MKSRKAQGVIEYVILVFLIILIVFVVFNLSLNNRKNIEYKTNQEVK